jgi:AcrR family transcriptional regulator
MSSRQEQLERTREALIEAGFRLAGRVGLGAMSVNLVVEEAGVSKGTFFHHFGDRAGYLLALHRRFHDRIADDVLAAMAPLPAGRERLISAAISYLDACLDNRGVRALLLDARADPAIAEEVRERGKQMTALCEADFGALRWPHPREGARLWVGLVMEAALIEFDAGGPRPSVREALGHYLGPAPVKGIDAS